MQTKYIGITGVKKSGKTTTIEQIVPILKKKGLTVGTVKIAFKDVNIDVNEEHFDVVRHRKANPDKTMFKSSIDTTYFINSKRTLREALKEFGKGLDIVLLEGFGDDLVGIPQIALLKEEKQESEVVTDYTVAISSIPEFNIKSKSEKYVAYKQLAEVAIKSSLPLFPILNCTHCGYDTCNDLVREIVAGKNTVKDCEVLARENAEVIVTVNDNNLPCLDFVQEIIKKVITGIITSLKLEDKELSKINIEVNYD